MKIVMVTIRLFFLDMSWLGFLHCLKCQDFVFFPIDMISTVLIHVYLYSFDRSLKILSSHMPRFVDYVQCLHGQTTFQPLPSANIKTKGSFWLLEYRKKENKKNTMEVNGYRQLFWRPTFFKISSFVFSRRKKLIQVWNKLRVSKWWQNF